MIDDPFRIYMSKLATSANFQYTISESPLTKFVASVFKDEKK